MAYNFNLPTRPAGQHGPGRPPSVPPLPMGWTEHKAPTATNTSTYTRPVAPSPAPFPQQGPFPVLPPYAASYGGYPQQQFTQPHPNQLYGQYKYAHNYSRGGFGRDGKFQRGGRHHQGMSKQKADRPKSKRAIPGKEPWVLVTTKQGRKFAHNTETKESLWKAPEDVQAAIDAMPEETAEEKEARRLRREERKREKEKGKGKEVVEGEKGEEREEEPRGVKRSASAALETEGGEEAEAAGEGDGEDEEEEDEEEEDEEEDAHKDKRLKTEGEASGPIEFTEDDIAWQLEAIDAEYGLNEEACDDEDEYLEEDAINQFKGLLNDMSTNPYSTWDSAYPALVDDPRYTLLPTTKARKEIFASWAKEKIAELKAEKEKEKKINPRIPFWDFLKEKATGTKLYWPEFRRKFKKEGVLRDSRVLDKEREKMFRDFVAHMKLSPALRENDLQKLLKATATLTRNHTLTTLPDSILTDVRYVAAPETSRDEIITTYISTLPETAPESDERKKEREERERQEQALRERQRAVRREQAKFREEERVAREKLREEVMEIERAKMVGKKGLLGHLVKKQKEEGSEEKRVKGKDEVKEEGEM